MERSYYRKQKTDITTVVVKKKLLNIILKTGGLKENVYNQYRNLSEGEKEAKDYIKEIEK